MAMFYLPDPEGSYGPLALSRASLALSNTTLKIRNEECCWMCTSLLSHVTSSSHKVQRICPACRYCPWCPNSPSSPQSRRGCKCAGQKCGTWTTHSGWVGGQVGGWKWRVNRGGSQRAGSSRGRLPRMILVVCNVMWSLQRALSVGI